MSDATTTTAPRRILDAEKMQRILTRMAHEILERNHGIKGLLLVGIRTRGVDIAHRLAQLIKEVEGHEVPVGILDITLYRDDLEIIDHQPVVRMTDIPVDVWGKRAVLIDDVLFTGRTVRAAIDALLDHGRPAVVQLAVLIDRGHRELPIQADYVGETATTTADELVDVHMTETDGVDEVLVSARDKN